MVKPEQVADGIIAYADAEMLPAMDGWQLIAATAALVLARQRIDLFTPKILNNKYVSALGIVDKNGLVDIDTSIAAIKESINKNGKLTVDVPMIGEMKFDISDFDKLKEYIIQSGTET